MEYAILQVGINDYPFVPLRGCVNDCLHLTEQFARYGYQTVKTQRLFDENATRVKIVENLRWLMKQDVPTLIFQYSGHGTRVRDRSGDETSGYDSAICPVDFQQSGFITDDELADLYTLVPSGQRLIILSDSCHSGKSQRAFITRWKRNLFKSPTPRFLPPNLIPDYDKSKSPRGWLTRRKNFLINTERCVLISACREDQTSADAWIGSKWQGAGTASLLYGWNRAGQWAPYTKVTQYANAWLKEHQYDQVLRVEGKAENIGRAIFS